MYHPEHAEHTEQESRRPGITVVIPVVVVAVILFVFMVSKEGEPIPFEPGRHMPIMGIEIGEQIEKGQVSTSLSEAGFQVSLSRNIGSYFGYTALNYEQTSASNPTPGNPTMDVLLTTLPYQQQEVVTRLRQNYRFSDEAECKTAFSHMSKIFSQEYASFFNSDFKDTGYRSYGKGYNNTYHKAEALCGCEDESPTVMLQVSLTEEVAKGIESDMDNGQPYQRLLEGNLARSRESAYTTVASNDNHSAGQ